MDAWLSLDFVAKRYGVLPSAVLSTGYNTDMICASLGVGYENYVARAHAAGEDPSKPKPTQKEMLAMIQKVRNDKNSSHTTTNSQ